MSPYEIAARLILGDLLPHRLIARVITIDGGTERVFEGFYPMGEGAANGHWGMRDGGNCMSLTIRNSAYHKRHAILFFAEPADREMPHESQLIADALVKLTEYVARMEVV